VLGGFDESLAGQELAHHPQGDQAEQATEEPQRHGLQVDGALDVRRLLGPDQVELGLSTDEAVELGDERRDVRLPPPETHDRLLEGEDLAPEGRERGRAHVSDVGADAALELRRELTGGRLNPDDPQGGPDRCVAGSARGVRGSHETDRDATSHVEVPSLGEGETHRDLIEGTREPAVQQLEAVDAGPDRRLAEDDEDRLGRQEVHPPCRRHLGETPDLFEGRGDEAGAEGGEDDEIRALLRAVEAAVGAVGAPRAHRSSHHRPRAEGRDQSQTEPPAPRTQLVPRPREDRAHRRSSPRQPTMVTVKAVTVRCDPAGTSSSAW
jgi:hypothetical protein